MTQVFSLSFLLVAPFWFLMMLAPGWRVTKRVIGSPWIAAPAAALYLALVLPQLEPVLGTVLSPDLPKVMTLFSEPAAVTVAWVHFLAFDLFVGRWVYLDAQKRGLSPLAVSPLLFLVLMLGPVGFLVYLGLRAWVGARGASLALTS